MATDGKCPRCAFKAPIVSFYQEAKDGRVILAFAKLPAGVQSNYFQYLSLFRPGSGCAMQSAKAERLTLELAEETNRGHVSQKGKVDRPCPPHIWSRAMEQMLERAGGLTLPVKTHGYLKTIAWDLANKEDAANEMITSRSYAQEPQVSQKITGMIKKITGTGNPMDDWIDGRRETKPTDEEMAEWKKKRFE